MSRYHANELLNNRKNDIQHWKYVKKIPVGKGYRYFYSWAEYKAYLADPTADLKKAGNVAKSEVKKSAKKSYTEVKKRGRKAVEKASSKNSGPNVTLSVVKAKNNSRPDSFKEKINKLAKKASEKWNSGRKAIKEKIEEGKEWVKNLFKKDDDKKEKKKEKKQDPYEKYKYIKKVIINGKTRYFYSQDELDVYNKRSYYADNDPDFMKKFKRSKDPYTKQEDAALVNSNYDWRDNNDNYEYNCRECTMIYELRRRGYDVESNGVSGYVRTNEGILNRLKDEYKSKKYNNDLFFKSTYFENPNQQKIPPTKTDKETAKAIRKEIDKNPPGSRGEIAVNWKSGGAHSMVWEKDKKGNIIIIDTQVSGSGAHTTRTVEELSKHVDNSNKFFGNSYNSVTRTDNLKLKKGISEICKNSSNNKRSDLGYKYERTVKIDSYTGMTEKERVTYYPVLLEEENRNGRKY